MLILSFRDRWNVRQTIKVSETERDALLSARAIRQDPYRRKKYDLIGHGAEFYRDAAGTLLSQPFVYEPARLPARELSALDSLRALGLHWEALTMAVRLNCSAMLHRAPCKSSAVMLTEARPVLFSPV